VRTSIGWSDIREKNHWFSSKIEGHSCPLSGRDAHNITLIPQRTNRLSSEDGPRFDKWANLQAETEELRLDLIRTELETCRTFATLAATEHQIRDREAAEHCTREANKAYYTVIRFLSRVTCADERRGFETKLKELRETLDDLDQRIAK